MSSDLLLQIMVWGGERHGLYFQDFTNLWKEPAHEQWQHQGGSSAYVGVWIAQETIEEETGKEAGEGGTAEEMILFLSLKG